MKRWLLTAGLALLFIAPLGADVTITTTTTIEGGMAAMTGGGMAPTVVTRIKGNKSRTDVEMGTNTIATLVDLATKQAILLRPDQKTAHIMDPSAAAAAAPAADMPMPTIETTVKPTGQSRQVQGATCDEYAISMKLDMSSMAGGNGKMPPEAAAALKDLRMNMIGSACVVKDGPGASEYAAFQSGAAKFVLGALAGGGQRGMPQGMGQMLTGFTEAPGIPYLMELTMGIEGTSPVADMMRKMGEMKIVSRVKSVSTEPLAEALFEVPADYKMVKP
jgi:hypothetical protein